MTWGSQSGWTRAVPEWFLFGKTEIGVWLEGSNQWVPHMLLATLLDARLNLFAISGTNSICPTATTACRLISCAPG